MFRSAGPARASRLSIGGGRANAGPVRRGRSASAGPRERVHFLLTDSASRPYCHCPHACNAACDWEVLNASGQ